MNNSVNRAERRLEDVEERMAGFGAPEPPEDLLAKIQAEIPVVLVAEERGAGSGTSAPSGSAVHRWRLLAASLAMVSLVGLFGYRLLRQGPAFEPTLEPAIDRGSELAAPGGAVIGEALDDSTVESDIEVPGPVVGEPTAGKDSGRKEEAAAEVSVGGSELFVATKPAAESVRGPIKFGAGASDEARGVGDSEGLRRQLDHRKTSAEVTLQADVQEELITVTSESPMLDFVSRRQEGLSNFDLDRVPGTRDPFAALGGNQSVGSAFDDATTRPRRVAPDHELPSDTRFQDYGTNPFVDTEQDPQSTFGIDVDTASYTVVRSYLERGLLPPPAAVRVEEFVNYFDYGDPAPRRRDFAVVAEGAPSPFAGGDAGSHLLRFALKGREVTAAERKPAVLTFVVDVSGSMDREDRLELVKRALRLLVRQLDDRDEIGLVIYGSNGEVLLEPTSDHRQVLRAIESLRPGGSTNAEEGLVLGYRTARNAFRPGAINRVILCSDGVANVGRTGPEAILRQIADEAASGIELTTVGFGMDNFNDVLMEQLADQGDGNYTYVDDISAARRAFVENLTGTLQTIAGDAKIQVEFNPAVVASYRLLGYENRDIADRDFRNDAVDVGEIGAGHQVTALYEVKLRERELPNSEPVATLRLRYRSARSGLMVEDAIDLEWDDLAWSWRAGTKQLRLAAIVAEFAEQLRGASRAAEVDLDRLSQLARDLVGRVGARDEVAELAVLIETAARLRESTGRPSRGDGFER